MDYVERVDIRDGWEELIDELDNQGLCECSWIIFEPGLQKAPSTKPISLSKYIMSYLLFDNVSCSLVNKNFN